MRRVVLISPLSGDVDRNTAYARQALLDCYRRGESAIASHLLWPQVLDDDDPDQREFGIEAGHAWIPLADAAVVYEDLDISTGMSQDIATAGMHGVRIEYRKISTPPREAA